MGIDGGVVEDHLTWLKQQQERYQGYLDVSEEHYDSVWKTHAARILPVVQSEYEFIDRMGVDYIVGLAQDAHRIGVEQEERDVDRTDAMMHIHSALPETRLIRDLLRRNTRWGLVLDAAVTVQTTEGLRPAD